ncbi:MAG: YesL family protein [Oscillospiraceae bacterium]|nr:YesL family protein [Oscillospiraceae bacterium]
MGRRFFNPDTGIWRFFGKAGDIVVLSLLWALCSVPVLTAGVASTALYDSAAHCIRRGEGSMFSRFFGTFRRELKTAGLTMLLWGAIAAVPVFLYHRLSLSQPDGQVVSIFSMLMLLLLYCILGILSWIFPLLSRFRFGFLGLQQTALRMAPGNILRTAVMAVLLGCGILLFFRNVLSVFFTPGLIAWLSTFLIEPVFEKYEEGED